MSLNFDPQAIADRFAEMMEYGIEKACELVGQQDSNHCDTLENNAGKVGAALAVGATVLAMRNRQAIGKGIGTLWGYGSSLAGATNKALGDPAGRIGKNLPYVPYLNPRPTRQEKDLRAGTGTDAAAAAAGAANGGAAGAAAAAAAATNNGTGKPDDKKGRRRSMRHGGSSNPGDDV